MYRCADKTLMHHVVLVTLRKKLLNLYNNENAMKVLEKMIIGALVIISSISDC